MKKRFTLSVLIPLCLEFSRAMCHANPQGLKVISGSVTTTQKGSTLQITASQGAWLQWKSFNIGPGQTTIFKQPSSTSIVFNKIGSASASKIYGSLQANGIVVLENLNGFYFGPNAFVRAGGLVVTTAAVNPWSSGGEMGWSFDGPPTKRPIVNYGTLETTEGGSLFLIGKQIENKGTISTPGGKTALLAGQEVLLSERPDGLSLSEPVQLPAGSVDNEGKIAADAGQVLLQAETVNNSGVIQANSVRQKNGVIELYASQNVQLAGSSVIQADGGNSGVSGGGDIVIKSDGTFGDAAGSQISAKGGASGGEGGHMEVSALSLSSLDSSVDAKAQAGWSEGSFTLDPQAIELGSAASGTISGATYMNVNTAFQNISADFTLLATQDITMDAGTTWDLSATTGQTSGTLTLEAGRNITLGKQGGAAATIKDANDWSMTLQAGNAGSGVVSGTGIVQLFTGSMMQTAAGDINVEAGNSVLLGSGGIVTGIANGAVMTGTGGNITVKALSGNVDGGTSKYGFNFKSGVLGTVDPALGGISTASGGNVTIQAGGNITDEPTTSFNEDAGSGAFGAAPGNVTLIAGGNVTGHFVVADGLGSIKANNAGTAAANLSLSLAKGAWDVNAAKDIVLQEVRNPNGAFDANTGIATPITLLFNYDPFSSVTLDAGDNVTIAGSADAKLPRNNNTEGLIFPPTLTIDAGPGGITLDSDVTLFPSPMGTLNISTTGGGNLQGNEHTIDLSDSSRTQYSGSGSFVYNDPDENVFLHLNDPNPMLINVSGSIENFYVDSSKPLQMFAAGNIMNSAASILNLRPSDTSVISAGGDITQQVNFAVVHLQPGDAPNLNALSAAGTQFITLPDGSIVPNPQYIPALAVIANSFYSDSASGGLVFLPPDSAHPQMTQAEYNALLQIHFLNQVDLNNLFQQSQGIAASVATGLNYQIAGPGTLKINAASLSLGYEGGVISQGIVGNVGLAPVTPRGANIDISVSGDLSMVASSIESQYGGNINIAAGGAIDVGSPLLGQLAAQAESGHLLGIASVWQGNINVVAEGDINVAGSRVAAYDGGNIFLESLQGNVNAGVGGSGATTVQKPYINRKGNIVELYDVIPGSGILATSYPQLIPGETTGEVGNITVETPQGNIVASKGGIVQLALGPVAQNNSTINLNAGTKNSDGTVEFVGDVDAGGSGVVGGQVNISATGSINGLVVASLGANVSALQNVSATVLSQGGATVSAGGTVSGTVVGVGSVSVSGASDVAAAFGGGGVTTSGAVSGAAGPAAPVGSSSAAAAATTQQVNQATQANSDVAAAGNGDDNDPLKKKKKAQLMEYVGRVTVLLPE